MVLVGAYENDRTLPLGDVLAKSIAPLERLRDAEPQEPHQLVDRRGGPGAHEQGHVLGEALTARRTTPRASSRNVLMMRPVDDTAVCVLP